MRVAQSALDPTPSPACAGARGAGGGGGARAAGHILVVVWYGHEIIGEHREPLAGDLQHQRGLRYEEAEGPERQPTDPCGIVPLWTGAGGSGGGGQGKGGKKIALRGGGG